MSSWPAHVEPLDRAIPDLLCSLPATWIDHDQDRLSSTQQVAVRLMTKAGLLEQRVRLEATITGINHTARILARVTGVVRRDILGTEILRRLPGWLDDEGGLRGEMQLISLGAEQIRLTDQGELARHDYERQTPDHPSAVIAFVRKLGFFAHRGDVTGKVVIEECTVEGGAAGAGDGPPPDPAAAYASASASIGDVNVHQHTHITNDFGELASLLRQILDRTRAEAPQDAAAAPPPPPVPEVSPDMATPVPPAPPASEVTPVSSSPPSKPTAKKSRMSTADAEAKAAAILARDGWPGDLRSLAGRVGCSHETLRKCASVKPYLNRSATPKIESGGRGVEKVTTDDLDPVEALAYEEEFRMIYKQAAPAERAKLDELTLDQQRRMVDLRRQQQKDAGEDDRPRYTRRRRQV